MKYRNMLSQVKRNWSSTDGNEQPVQSGKELSAHQYRPARTPVWFQGWLFTSGGTGRNHPATEGYTLLNEAKNESKQSDAADFEGSLSQDGDKITLHQKLALKKRVYEAADWDGFRSAVNAHKSFGDYLIIKNKRQ